jgi:RNA polymerase sigma factor (sigma-70 family)
MRNDPQVIELVTRARSGDRSAWDELVDRYSPLIWSICHRWQLDRTDAEDVGQAVWLRLVEQLDKLRDPAALPGWLATTTQRECCRVRRSRCRLAAGAGGRQVPDAENLPDEQTTTAEDGLLMAERHAALREAFMDLPGNCQELVALLITEPPTPYAEISVKLGIPVGSIGPNRSRCLDRLRRHPAIAALIDAEAANTASPPQLGGDT